MTRFNITFEESVKFVLKCCQIKMMKGGEIFVPKIPSYNILDVAKAISSTAQYKFIGIRPGEKLHEEMITITDGINTAEFDDYYVIMPNTEFSSWTQKKFINFSQTIKGKHCKEGFNYSSQNNKKFLSVKQIRKLISDMYQLGLS